MRTELQAVILAAGKGSRMTELTNKIPKCLLPIANKPMIHFPLVTLIEADFKDVIIIVPHDHKDEIEQQLSKGGYNIKMDFVAIPHDKDLGTAESLKQISKKITSDLLILSCDFISNYPLKNFINFYRIHDPSLLALIADGSSVPNQGLVPGRKDKFKTDKDIIGIDAQNHNRLVFLNSEVDFDESNDFKISMFKLCPSIDVFTRYLDSHVYILKKYLINYLNGEKNTITSIKGELVPSVIRNQFKKELNQDSNNDSSFGNKDGEMKRTIASYIQFDELKTELDRFDPLTYGGANEDNKSKLRYPNNQLCCSPIIVDSQKYFIARSNNILSYYEINKLFKQLVDVQVDNFHRSQISDSLIKPNHNINDRTSIKNTIIGNNCTINEKTRLENCLIMDNVVIDKLCVIKNSIVCHNVKIGDKCSLNDCIVSSDKQIANGSSLTHESIVGSDQMLTFEI